MIIAVYRKLVESYFVVKGDGFLRGKEILNRLVQMILTLLGVTFLTFALTYIAPGDPVEMLLEVGDVIIPREVIEETRKQLGLDQPFHIQYIRWLGGVLTGDMGMSYSARVPVAQKLMEALPGTLLLAGSSLFMMIIVSLPLGIISALKRNTLIDNGIRFLTFIGISMPTFWVGLMLLYIFGLQLGWFPIAGGEVEFRRMVLPAVTLAISMAAKYTRQVRTAVLEELNQDYVMGAKARGIPMSRILWHHIMPNACLPLITLLGLTIGWLLGGSAVIEMVFGWPGLGKLAVRSIEMRDYPLVMGFVLWIASFYMIINFIIDCSYHYLDPRIRKGTR